MKPFFGLAYLIQWYVDIHILSLSFWLFPLVTEDEIRRGIITVSTPEKHCFWFKRVITDLIQNADERNAAKFVDKTYGAEHSVIDESDRLLSCQEAFDYLRNIQSFNPSWKILWCWLKEDFISL